MTAEDPASPAGGKLDLDRLRSIGHLSHGQTRSRSRSGREHPESGEPYKVTRDELGNDVTEHGKPGSGLSDRQDVNIRPGVIHFDMGMGQ
jgi:hypothetical protein